MKKKLIVPTLENFLKLMSLHLVEYSGESRRSYQKAFTSIQLYIINHYPISYLLDDKMIINWVLDNLLHGLAPNTVSFYLDKISSLYGNVAYKFIGGKLPIFKDVKLKVKTAGLSSEYSDIVQNTVLNLQLLFGRSIENEYLKKIFECPLNLQLQTDEDLLFKWTCLAINAGIRTDIILYIIKKAPYQLNILNLCEPFYITDPEKLNVLKVVERSFFNSEPEWFAMRLRPKVKYEEILERFARISDQIKMPELFYPCEEIAKRINKKIIWEGRPIIRDVVFFKAHKSEIYQLFSRMYDLAWCYRTPGGAPGDYASIPSKAMEDFKKGLNLLTPDFELAPAGKYELKPGDEVILINGGNINMYGKIIKKASYDDMGNKIFRISLLNGSTRWDIGVDARLLKKKE